MEKNYIESVRKQMAFAQRMAEECIIHLLEPYGEEGLELNEKLDAEYSVIYEIIPNEFKKVVAVRVVNDKHLGYKLHKKVEDDTSWTSLNLSYTDARFLLDEIESAIRAESEGV